MIFLIIVGSLAGLLILPPVFHIARGLGISMGFISTLILACFIPGGQKRAEPQRARPVNANRPSTWQYLTYPTQLPLTLGIFWLLCFMGISLLFKNMLSTNGIMLLFIPIFFFFGLGGLMMAIRKEYILRSGAVVKRKYTFAWGIICMLGFWGYGIFLLATRLYTR